MKIYSGTAYKFMSIEGLIATLENESIRFTRGDMFNDPFESNPYLVSLNWSDEIPKFTENPKLHSYLHNVAFEKIFSDLYIACFTKSYKDEESKLMWSHYANNHNAVCIEFDLSPSKEDGIYPIDVTYVEDLVTERNNLTPEDTSEKLPLFLSTTKSKIWAYEKEIRYVLYKTGYEKNKNENINVSEDSKYAYLPLNLKNIKRIIFGVNSKKEDALRICNILIKKNITVPFSKLIICPTTLSLIEDSAIEEKLNLK